MRPRRVRSYGRAARFAELNPEQDAMKSHRPRSRRIAALALAGAPADHRRQLAGATIGASPATSASQSPGRRNLATRPSTIRAPRAHRECVAPVTSRVVASGARSCATSTRLCLSSCRARRCWSCSALRPSCSLRASGVGVLQHRLTAFVRRCRRGANAQWARAGARGVLRPVNRAGCKETHEHYQSARIYRGRVAV
jgi:hypothetical protein